MKIKTVITFDPEEFDRLLDLSFWGGTRVIQPENGVGEARMIRLEVSAGLVLLRMTYFGIRVDGAQSKNIQTWHLELAPTLESIVLVVGPDATNAIEAAVASLGDL